MTKTSPFHMEHATVVDTSMDNQIVQQFIAATAGHVYANQFKLAVRKTVPLFNIFNRIHKIVGDDARLVMPMNNTVFIQNADSVVILSNQDRHNEETDDVWNLHVQAYADKELVTKLKEDIEKEFLSEKMAKIKWWYEGRHGNETRDIYMPPNKTKLLAEFYPDLGDPYAFMDKYMASDASVLLLAGPPGTGKTTWLRHLIIDRKLSAHVIYDEKLMEKDAVFQSFLFDDSSEVMVIEDADTILESRDDGNKMMARFLSVSDGLIKLPNKKLVFTTNLTDFGRADEALLRPGRCFGVVKTRELDLNEAQAAARAAGLIVPTEKRLYSLAELFNQGQGSRVRKIGFAA